MYSFKKTIKYGIYLVFLLPLIFTKWTLYPSHFGKTSVFQILITILSLFFVYYFFTSDYNQELRRNVKFKPIDWAIIIFLTVSFASAIFGLDFNRSFWGDQARAQGVFTLIYFTLFYFLLRYNFTSKKDWEELSSFLLIISFFSSLIAWFGLSLPLLSRYISDDARISGLIGNPIFFANYLMIPVFLSFFSFFYFKDKNYKWRWIWAGIGIIDLVSIIGTQTRGPLIGLTAGILLIIILYIFLGGSRKAKVAILWSVSALILILALGYFLPKFRGVLPNKLSYIYTVSPSSATGQTRLMAWKIAYKGWKASPIIGNGPQSYQYIFDKYYNPKFLAFKFEETVWDQPHNYILEVLNSSGILGLLVYLAIIFLIAKMLWDLIKGSQKDNIKLGFIILAGAFFSYIIQLQFSFETSNSLHLWVFLMAFLVWLRYNDLNSEKEFQVNKNFLKSISKNLIIILVAGLGVGSLYYNYLMLHSSYYTNLAREARFAQEIEVWEKAAEKSMDIKSPFKWEQAVFLMQDLSIFDANGKLNKEILENVGPKIEKVFLEKIKRQPDAYLYKFWLGQLYTFMGEYRDKNYYKNAEDILMQAWQINKSRQQVHLLLGKLYFLQGDKKRAIEVLQELVNNNPDYGEPHWFLGLILISDGQNEAGVIELEKGLDFALPSKANIIYLIDTYAKVKRYEKIVPFYKELISREPDNASYYASLAATYMALGDTPNAVSALNKAVELDPSLKEEAINFLKAYNIPL